MIALIGSTGFIGSAFARALEARSVKFIALERDAIYNQLVDVVIDANGNSKKFIAEKHPHFDFQSSVASVSSRLTSLRYSTYVYLSSGEVYGVDQYVSNSSEDVCILEPARSYYGMHRRLAEFLVGAHAKRNFIFRLGGFTGNGLRKNPVYDIVNGNALFVHPDSAFQFMDVDFAANLMLDLLFQHKQDEDEQQLNKNEQERFIPFEIVIDFQKRLAEQYITNPTYKNNQDLVFISLYRYLPQRDELKQLELLKLIKIMYI